jgi:hypothetical protein
LDEPWNSPANAQVLLMTPESYRSPQVRSPSGNTNYFSVVGAGMSWSNGNGPMSLQNVNANHVLVIEVTGIDTPWLQPRDLTIEEVIDVMERSSHQKSERDEPAEIMYITAGGDVRTVSGDTDADALRDLLLGEIEPKETGP